MLNLNINIDNEVANISISGRLDTSTSGEFEAKTKEVLSTKEVNIDAKELEYISSAGLRCLLVLYKNVGNVNLINANEQVKEVLEMTGFDSFIKVR